MHEEVELFNKMLLNIFHNFIPNKIILCDDKDPPWMNEEIKNFIKRKNWLFQCQRKSGNLDCASLNSIAQDISNIVNPSKQTTMSVLHSIIMTLKHTQKPIGKY